MLHIFAYFIVKEKKMFAFSSSFHVSLFSMSRLVSKRKRVRKGDKFIHNHWKISQNKIELAPSAIVYSEISGYIISYKVIDFPLEKYK